jgi:amidase
MRNTSSSSRLTPTASLTTLVLQRKRICSSSSIWAHTILRKVLKSTGLTSIMGSRAFLVIQPKDVPRGTPEYETKRAALLSGFESKVPQEYYLADDIFTKPPSDVSGIPLSCGLLSAEEVEITEKYDAVGLAEAIAQRRYTAVSVAKAFSKRAIIAHQLTCCLTQWFMDEAVQQAQILDDYLAENGQTVGPLHGVPISIKEHLALAGTYSSQGSLASTIFNDADCHLVRTLRKLGAVFYCKTNQPQSLMHLETNSHWGRTLNPYNIHLSAGGSSGGEAALIALRGSILGVGTDIGGSIRAPSAFCGIYGFKPTSYTLSTNGTLASPSAAELNILCSIGPMCHSVRDMDFFMKGVLDTKPYLSDPSLVPIPWTGLQTPCRRLKVGIISNDGFIEPQPPVKRAISWATDLLSDPKHAEVLEIKPFHPFNVSEAWTKIRKMYWLDGAKPLKEAISSAGEPIHPLSQWIWKDAEARGMQTVQGTNLARRERDDFRCEFAKAWSDQDVDVVIGPAFVGPACAHDTAFYWTYTALWNLVDYPSLVFPTPLKTGAKESYDANYAPLSRECLHVKALWEASGFEGAPVNLQLVGRRYHDNQLFGALALLKDILNLH